MKVGCISVYGNLPVINHVECEVKGKQYTLFLMKILVTLWNSLHVGELRRSNKTHLVFLCMLQLTSSDYIMLF